MILDYFGIYFTAFFVSGIIFTHSEERREGFWKKMLLFIVGMLALAAAILGLPRENESLQNGCRWGEGKNLVQDRSV